MATEVGAAASNYSILVKALLNIIIIMVLLVSQSLILCLPSVKFLPFLLDTSITRSLVITRYTGKGTLNICVHRTCEEFCKTLRCF